MRSWVMVVAMLAACSTRSPDRHAPPADAMLAKAPPDAPLPDAPPPDAPPPDAPPPDAVVARTDCKADATAEQACLARTGYTYGPEPYFRCGGVQQTMDTTAAALARIRHRACTCSNKAAVERRRRLCMQVP